MIDFSWHIEDEDRDPDVVGSPRPILGTWHFLRKALRRKWLTWAGLSALGGLLGMAVLALAPPASAGTATLLMAHPSGTDSESAMATDVSLLNTRAVATAVIDRLDLGISPEAFQSSITPEQVTSQVLKITVKAPDDAAAVERANVLVKEYLAFRSAQMTSLTDGLISGYQTRIAALEQQVSTLSRQYNQFSEQGAAGQSRAAEALSQRTELNSQITTMQRAVEDATLQTSAAIMSTRVIDLPRAVPRSAKKAAVLDVASGIIAGGAIGVGLVLFRALTSERLRRRQEIALALGVPVRFSVPSTGPPVGRIDLLRRRLWALVPRRGLWGKDVGQPWRGWDLQTMVHGLESAIVPPTGWRPQPKNTERHRGGSPAREAGRSGGAPAAEPQPPRQPLALAAIGNTEAAADILEALAAQLRRLGLSVLLVDLSAGGALQAIADSSVTNVQGSPTTKGQRDAPLVLRPQGLAGLSRGPLGTAAGTVSDIPDADPARAAWDAADVVLALVEVDPGLDVENLRTWVTQVVPLVTTGQSTAELLGTIADLIRGAGLGLHFAMQLAADKKDESLGVPQAADLATTGASARSGQQ